MVRFTNEPYDASKCVRIVNPVQQAMYMKQGVYPIDIYVGFDDKTVFIFLRESTKDVYKKWLNYELN